MKVRFAHRRHLLVTVATILWAISRADAAALGNGGELPKAKVTRVISMIDALASRNPAPIVSRDHLACPRFAKDYDWNDQERVLGVLEDLRQEHTLEAWDELLNHHDDSRYCVTMMPEGDTDLGLNRSVGGICRLIAKDQLAGPMMQHLARDIGTRPMSIGFLPRNLVEWRKERPEKAMYELQIEICELAQHEAGLPRKSFTDDARRKMREGLEAEIEKLERTKLAAYLDDRKSLFRRFEFYSARIARNNRAESPEDDDDSKRDDDQSKPE